MEYKYRENSFFKENTYYLFKRNDGFIFESMVTLYNGNWYTNESLNYKATSLLSMEGRLIGRECFHKKYGIKGKITNKMKGTHLSINRGKIVGYKNQWGVFWYNNKSGMLPYWNDRTDIIIIL